MVMFTCIMWLPHFQNFLCPFLKLCCMREDRFSVRTGVLPALPNSLCITERWLTPGRNYMQIDKELLAIVFARKFHHHVYGVTVSAQSDHKPLENMLRNPLGTPLSRLQRMLLQLKRHDQNGIYKLGKELLITDMLSWAVIQEQDITEDGMSDEKVVSRKT